MPFIQHTNSETPAVFNLPKSILKGIVGAFIITFAVLVCFALIITFTSLSEAYADTMVTIATYAAVAAGGCIAAGGSNGKGWLTGAVTGIIYMLLLWISSCISNSAILFSMSIVGSMVIGAVCGAIGGIIGINVKR